MATKTSTYRPRVLAKTNKGNASSVREVVAKDSSLSPRERVLSTATRLFYAQGVRGTGIDQIISEAQVAKATLYAYFPAKTDLVRAYLEARHESWMAEFATYLKASRRRGLAALADALGRWFDSGDFNGCAFINVTAESVDDEWRQISCAHKEALGVVVANQLGGAGTVAEPETGARSSTKKSKMTPAVRAELIAQALLVIEGMIVRFQMTRDRSVVDRGRALLVRIEDSAVQR